MDKVLCPQCKEIVERPELKLDQALDEMPDFTCPECEFTTSAWQFDVVYIEDDEEPKMKIEVGVLHPCGGLA